MKNTIFFALFCVSFWSHAQVGINTTTPNAQLDIKSSNQAAPANTDGILIPKVDAFPAINPTAAQKGMLVYLTTISGANQPGFYYWNNPGWVGIVSGSAGGTLDQAYDFGGAGLGKTITADTGAVTIVGTDGLVSTGTFGSGALVPSGAGTRMVWNPRKGSFRAGSVFGAEWNDASIGFYSTAFGSSTTASGIHSTAFGAGSVASSFNSTAFGSSTIASGSASTAFGSQTTATGDLSTAFGDGTIASSPMATAFGQTTIASGQASTAFGLNTIASGFFSTAFGGRTTATGSASIAFGFSNTAPSFGETSLGIGATTYTPPLAGSFQFRAVNSTDRLVVVGNAIDANNNDIVDVGERSDALVILKNGLTRLPSTTNAMITAADGKAVVTKEYLVANSSGTLDQAYDFGGAGVGKTITADAGAVLIDGTDGLVSTGTTGSGAVAPSGDGTRMVWNPNKAAFRAGTLTSGTGMWDDTSIGVGSVAMGRNTFASGDFSVAMGDNNRALGIGSIAFGINTYADFPGSTAFGTNTQAANASATAMGFSSQASGASSTAMGFNTLANNYAATSMGQLTTASGSKSTAMGDSTTASGEGSIAMGGGTTASGQYSFAMGFISRAIGIRSTSLGMENTASSYGETVIGIGATTYTPSVNGATQFRAANITDRLLVVGNAIDANNNSTVDVAERSDALVILKNGNTGIGSSTPQDKLHVVGNIRMVDGNQAAGRVLTSDANGTATWQSATANVWSLTGNTGTNSNTNFLGTTDNRAVGLRTNGKEALKIESDGSLYIGMPQAGFQTLATFSASPLTIFESQTEGTKREFHFRQASNVPAESTSINFNRYRNTISTNSFVLDGDELGRINFKGAPLTAGSFFGFTAFAASIQSVVDGAVASPNVPGRLNFLTTPVGANVPQLRMTVRSNGNVGINADTPAERLHVVGNIRMVDGNQAAGKVFTSDANGTATWQNASANAWGLVGNAGTNAATNFIGTTDNVDLVFRRFNTISGRIGNSNTFLGRLSGSVSTGTNNTYIGTEAGRDNVSGQQNVYIGRRAGTLGATGSDNIFIGNGAGILNEASQNCFTGSFSGNGTTTGANNSFYGYFSGNTTGTGSQNAFFGASAGTANTTGIGNTLVGTNSNVASNNLTNATAIGFNATVGASNSMVLGSINGVNSATSSVNVGIGTTTPARTLHVSTGASGGTPNANSDFVLESNGAVYQHFLAPSANESGILFGTELSSIRGGVLYNNATDNLLFRSGGNTTRMTVTAAGNVGIGTSAPGGQFELALNEGRKPTSNTWTIPSDARLKNVNGFYEKGLAEIAQLKPIRYNYKNTDKKIFDEKVLNKEAYGFLAQEVQTIFPEAVGTDPDGYLNFDLHPILIASVNALKELNAKNEQLEKENQSLKESVQAINDKMLMIIAEMEKLKK